METNENVLINKVEDFNIGNTIKSGDQTLLKYKILDGDGEILDLAGSPCRAVVKKHGREVYSTTDVTIAADNVAQFRITEVLPADEKKPYMVEFIINEDDKPQIFPSKDTIELYILSSSILEEKAIIQSAGCKTAEEIILKKANPILDGIDEAEATRRTSEDTRVTNELAREQSEEDRKFEEMLRQLSEADRGYGESTRVAAESNRKATFDELVDTGVLQTNINTKLSNLEQTYAPKLAELDNNEDARKTAESARETNEAERILNEDGRVAAENERQTNYNELVDTGVIQENINQKLAAAEAEYAPRLASLEKKIAQNAIIMGVEWDKQADPTLTRIGGSKDFVANIGIGEEVVQNDFDYAPIYREIIRETDDLGNTFVRIPRFYIRKTDDEGLLRLEISKEKIEGFYLPYVFWDFENSKELDYFYYGAYMASLSTDGAKLESKPGSAPLVSRNIVQFRDFARANGSGYQQLDIHAIDVIRTLFFVEFATLNSQSIHPGYTSGSDAAALTGGMDGVVASSGSMGTSSSHQFVYRGIEDLWGNTWQFVDGVNINDHQAWVCEDANSYASNVFAAPYQKLSYVNADTSGYVKEMGFDPSSPYARFVVTLGAGTTTYYSDYYHQNTGQRVARFGGNWSDGANVGLSCWHLNFSSANAGSNVSGRLLRKAPV